MRPAWPPLTVSWAAPGPLTVGDVLMDSSPLVSVMVWPSRLGSKTMVSLFLAAAISARSEPEPLSLAFTTVSVLSSHRSSRASDCGRKSVCRRWESCARRRPPEIVNWRYGEAPSYVPQSHAYSVGGERIVFPEFLLRLAGSVAIGVHPLAEPGPGVGPQPSAARGKSSSRERFRALDRSNQLPRPASMGERVRREDWVESDERLGLTTEEASGEPLGVVVNLRFGPRA
jgi:hypothetical protein